MKTQVYITIDAEFSIGGAFADPRRYRPVAEPALLCPVNGRSRGLGFILDTFRRHDLRATFFVEALNTFYFGDEPMGALARRIHGMGHDVQMHLHPCWEYFRREDWQRRLRTEPPNDEIATRSEEQLLELIRNGQEVFRRWGLPAPVAVRAGNLHAERHFYRAMYRAGLRLASNVGLGLHRPRDTGLHLRGGRHWIDGVLEMPVLSYTDLPGIGGGRCKILTVTGSAWGEFRYLLEETHRRQQGPVVILTHAHEYVKHRDLQFRRLRDNRVNQRRLHRLCAWLREHDDRFEVVTFGAQARTLLQGGGAPSPDLSMPPLLTARRLAENWLNDHLPWY